MTRAERKARKVRAMTEARTDYATRSSVYNARRSRYQQALQKAAYFAWAATKPYPALGNDPMTGRPFPYGESQDVGPAMNVGAARLYLRMARDRRASMLLPA